MNIAHLLPYSAKFPLNTHNGRYEWVLRLANLHASQGHRVTIYAGPGSKGGIGITWQTLAYDFNDRKINNIALIKLALQQNEHDIYHSHYDFLHYLLADSAPGPVMFTQHWLPDEKLTKAAEFDIEKKVLAIPATKYTYQENRRLGIKSAPAIYHGIDTKLFCPAAEPHTDRLLFAGRIAPQKGVLEAVKIARAAHQKLDIVGKVNAANEAYWQQILRLVDGDQIRYLGHKSQTELVGLMQQAKAFLFPMQAPEPFGQTTIEAQACGTPVIISDMGASNELVQDGKSGFLAKTEADFVRAIQKIDQINREDCRRHAQRFNIHDMAAQYIDLYKKLSAA